MTDTDTRVAEAHRRAFALLTHCLTDPDADPRGMILELAESVDELLDVSACLVWHAAGAIVTHTGDQESAVALVRQAALEQETKQ